MSDGMSLHAKRTDKTGRFMHRIFYTARKERHRRCLKDLSADTMLKNRLPAVERAETKKK